MGFFIVKGDLLEQNVDAIVVPTSPNLKLQGIIGERIKKICGQKIVAELEQCKELTIGSCLITNAYNLPCKKIIHVANPKYIDGNHSEKDDLESSYIECINLALDFELSSIAFPLLSCGAYHFPRREAINIAIETILENDNEDLNIQLVIYDENIYTTYKDIFSKYKIVGGHLEKNIQKEIEYATNQSKRFKWYKNDTSKNINDCNKIDTFANKLKYFMGIKCLNIFDVSCGVISEQGLYKILNGAIPSKNTAISLGINMSLNLNEINELLLSISESLNPMIPRDAIIINGIVDKCDVSMINSRLKKYGYSPIKEFIY